jgi:putative transposase
MPRYIRPRLNGATIFFTLALADRKSDLLVRDIDRLRLAVALTLRERPFHIDAWVVLPDHLHAVWTLPETDSDYATRWRLIKARFSHDFSPSERRSASKVRHGEKGIWQRRFWEHHIRDADDYARHVEYCWFNPVKHSLAEHPADWPHSSLHRDLREGRAGREWSRSDQMVREPSPSGSERHTLLAERPGCRIKIGIERAICRSIGHFAISEECLHQRRVCRQRKPSRPRQRVHVCGRVDWNWSATAFFSKALCVKACGNGTRSKKKSSDDFFSGRYGHIVYS